MIVDEEQRFGVAQKELLRQLRLEVDVLALTRDADPAHAAHVARRPARHLGDRDAARGPPADPHVRRRVRRGAVKHALERELERGGQAFYLHNRVETIEEAAEKLRQLCPELRFLVAHGQMREQRARGADARVPRGDADVLVSTTIIESGLDIPQANTLIVERADMLGLAQLYQIRGRVGRSRRARARVPLLSRRARADARGARAARDARRPHRARRRLRDRDARPRDPRRRRPARRGAVGPRRRARLRALRRDAARGRRRALRASGASPRGRCASTRASTPTSRPRTSPPRRSRSTSTAGSRSPRTRTSCASCGSRLEDRYGPLPEPVENLFAIQEAKLKLARLGADYLVFRGGRASVGPVVLGSGELRALRERVDTAVYSTGKREVTLARRWTSTERSSWSMLCSDARQAA